MKKWSGRFWKPVKILLAAVFVCLAMMFLFPIVFPGKIESEVKEFANRKLNGKLDFTEANLSFFDHFPSLTLTLKDFSLKGSAPFKDENLVSASGIGFGINLKSLIFDRAVKIDEIYLSGADINIRVNENGEANYNVYVPEDGRTDNGNGSASLKLDRIAIENAHLRYDDRSAKILIDARDFNYLGKGDLDRDIFDLKTSADIGALDFTFDNQAYLKDKTVHAKLITQINTNSLAFVFRKNDLKINRLPVSFTGKFDFLKNGYDMDFAIRSEESRLSDFFTALPPAYVTWLEKASVEGETSVSLTLKGKYIASENKAPDLAFNMKIREGEIRYKDAPFPASHIFLNFGTQLPGLNPERLKVNLDSLYFDVGKDYLKAIVKSTGLSKPTVHAAVKGKLDLKTLDRALGIGNADMSGKLDIDLVAEGVYDKEKGIFPKASGNFDLANGYIRTIYYPHPVESVNVSAKLSNGGGTFAQTVLDIPKASFRFEGKPFYLTARFANFDDVAYDVKAKGEIDVARIYKVFSRKGLGLDGYIKADVAFSGRLSDASAGRYDKLQNSGTLILRNIRTRSEYLPKPFIIDEGIFKFHQNDMDFSGFKASYGHSDFAMDGRMSNVIHFALSDREILHGAFTLHSRYIDADEFMAQVSETKTDPVTNRTKTAAAPGVILIPEKFDLKLSAEAAKLDFNGLHISDAKSALDITGGKLILRDAGFGLIGCKIALDAEYEAEAATRAGFRFKVDAKDFDIKKAYDSIPMFREMATAAASAEGIISLQYEIGGKLGADMMPVYPSLEGGGVLSVRKVRMKGFRLMNAVSQSTGKDALRDPDLSKVDIRTKVRNNIMTIDRFKFKVAGFRPRIEGQTSLDGKLNLKMRLGLPPLGIIGIPLTITGTQDEPKIKLGKKSEELQETAYDPNAPQPTPDVSAPVGKNSPTPVAPETGAVSQPAPQPMPASDPTAPATGSK